MCGVDPKKAGGEDPKAPLWKKNVGVIQNKKKRGKIQNLPMKIKMVGLIQKKLAWKIQSLPLEKNGGGDPNKTGGENPKGPHEKKNGGVGLKKKRRWKSKASPWK